MIYYKNEVMQYCSALVISRALRHHQRRRTICRLFNQKALWHHYSPHYGILCNYTLSQKRKWHNMKSFHRACILMSHICYRSSNIRMRDALLDYFSPNSTTVTTFFLFFFNKLQLASQTFLGTTKILLSGQNITHTGIKSF